MRIIKEPIALFLGILALATIVLMIWSYTPYQPGNDYKGDPPYSIYYCPALVVTEFILALITIRIFQRNIHWIKKVLLLIFWGGLTFASFIYTLYGGNVPAAHALWMLLVSSSLLLYLIFWIARQKLNKHRS